MLATVISVTSKIDITGQARKMGRSAGMRNNGTNDSANMNASKAAGEISLRTINPGEADGGSMEPKTGSVDSAIRSKSWVR